MSESTTSCEQRYVELLNRLDSCGDSPEEVSSILSDLIVLAECGFHDACEVIGEFLATRPAVRDPKAVAELQEY